MLPYPHVIAFLLLPCLLLSCCLSLVVGISSGGIQTNIRCSDKEREALLMFKQGIEADHCGLLSSWTNQKDNRDCCQWHGIRCSNLTGRVSVLDLHGGRAHPSDPTDLCLVGKISPALQELKDLTYLDLSMNNFQYQPIPSFIGSFTNLRYLNLSVAGFRGEVPHHLGNLSKLASLDLSGNFNPSCFPCVHAKSLQWLSRITSLRNVNLGEIDLSEATDWMQIVNNLPFLEQLRMHECRLSPRILPSLSYANCSTTLAVLVLSSNLFSDTSIYQWLFNLSQISTHIAHVDLQYNYLPGAIPSYFGNMQSLEYLDLSLNLIQHKIPSALGNMSSLSYLSLIYNQLEGAIPETFSKLEYLEYLDLTGNFLQGSGWVQKALGNLCSLKTLSLSNNNNLSGDVSSIIETLSGCAYQSLAHLDLSESALWGSVPDSISKFSSLRELHLENNELNGTISPGLGQLSMLQGLYLNSNSLRGSISDHHLSNLSRLRYLYLNENPELVVDISPNWLPPFQLYEIHLSGCRLGPRFPNWLATQTDFSELDISNAVISDAFPPFWRSLPSNLRNFNMSCNEIYGVLPEMSITFQDYPIVDLSSNSFTGAIPSFLWNASSLDLNDNKFSDLSPFFCPQTKMVLSQLDLSNNLFSGEVPDCWMYFDRLSVLHLENNKFQGRIPSSLGRLKNLQVLHLGNNSLSGELPASLENCTSMIILDLAYNNLTGYINPKIGYRFTSLGFLKLRKNKFHGGIPWSLCQLSHLQILDFSANHFSGAIPKCISNFTAMIDTKDYLQSIDFKIDTDGSVQYEDVAWLMWKRKERSFMSSLGLVKSIDLSDNDLQGQIPEGVASLHSLVSLDLSGNNLSGSIKPSIGQLTSLEYLDLSNNHLSGEIPTSLASLNSLEILNLSNNNLSGRIPTGPQLQTFDASAYKGNQLCGAPLPKCLKDQSLHIPKNGDEVHQQQKANDRHVFFLGLCISVVLGFITGFWVVVGTLVLKSSWRLALFQFIEDKTERLSVMITSNIARAYRKP